MGKFLVKNAANGFKFGLIVANDEIILNSEIYSSEAACLAGIESVKKNALIAKLEDQTVEGYKVLSNPKYEIFKDKKDMQTMDFIGSNYVTLSKIIMKNNLLFVFFY